MKRDVSHYQELTSRFKACVSCAIKLNKKADESPRMKMSRDGLTLIFHINATLVYFTDLHYSSESQLPS